jgi:AcrR family transcriptional regulator
MNEKKEQSAPTGGLRERQRILRRQSILFAAGDLFASKSFDAVSLEEVAAAAGVSVPTIYSFFKSKQDLLLGLLGEDRQLLEPKLAGIVASLSDDPAESLFRIAHAVVADGYDVTRKVVWREILAASLRSPAEQRNQFRDLQAVSAKYIRLAIVHLQGRDALSAILDLDSATRIVHGAIRRVFQLYTLSEEMDQAEMMRMLLLDLKTIITGLK